MTLLFISIIIAAGILSFYKLWKTSLPPRQKLALIIIRIALLALILGIFFQPSFKINRLASPENNILVLLDCSSSMQLFATDSIPILLSTLSKVSPENDAILRPQFTFFCFGDSLRQLSAPAKLNYHDNNSLFPQFFTDNQLKKYQKVLIISDGNWTNPVPSHSGIRDKECYYLPLRQRTRIAYLHLDAPEILNTIVSDTSWTVPVQLSGFTTHAGTINLRCSSKYQTLAEKNISVDSGFFTETAALQLPSKQSGTRLLELSAHRGDSLICTRYLLQKTTPKALSAFLYATSPSLDKRFLVLALERQTGWTVLRKNAITSRSPDAILIFDWNPQAQKLIRKYPKKSLVFIGCLPCNDTVTTSPPQTIPTVHYDFRHLFNMQTRSHFPPLQSVLSCRKAPFTIQRSLLSIDSVSEKKNTPLMFEALYKGNLILVFAARGIWRWDFWPQSVAKNRNAPFFSDFLIGRIKELVEYNTNKNFYVYPSVSPLYDSDSISLKLALPSYLFNFSSVAVRTTVSNLHKDTVLSHTITSTPFHLQTHPLKIPPCSKGSYVFTCTISSQKGITAYSDTLTVIADNSEFQVSGQNTVLLEELAYPLPSLQAGQLITFFTESPNKGQRNEITTRIIHLRRTWLILATIFGLFCLEWILRRVWRLD